MVKLAEEEKMKTKHSKEELQEAMSEQGAEKAFEAYKEKVEVQVKNHFHHNGNHS